MKIKIFTKTGISALLFGCLVGWPAMADDATQMWNSNCAACHGKDGIGQTMMGSRSNIKDLTDPKVQASFTDAQATKTIKEGYTDEYGKQKMKAFSDKFSDDDIKALVAKVRSFKPAK